MAKMYSIPIIPNDLRHEETIIQAAYALDSLNKTINTIFEKIDKRLENNNVKVKALGERITKAQTKIEGLVGTKKAIKLYAPSRFPANHILQDIPATFNINDLIANEENCKTINSLRTYDIQSRPELLQNSQEKLLFFHVRSNEGRYFCTKPLNEEIMQNRKDIEKKIKRGVIDKSLRSVSSILLYNSDDYVYGDDNDFAEDPWMNAKYRSQREKRKENHRKELAAGGSKMSPILEPPPVSLQNRNEKRLTPAGDLRYMPSSSDAPEIDLPMDLPDLPGIADDIQFDSKDQLDLQIAPSLLSANLPDLEELETNNKTNQGTSSCLHISNIPTNNISDSLTGLSNSIPSQINIGMNSSNATIISSTNVTQTQPPPPPPPPPPPAPTSPALISTAIIPPPPPPPVGEASKGENPKKSIGKIAENVDTHAALMDSIRKAGGTRGGLLRVISNEEDDSVTKRATGGPDKKKFVGNDLMMDLHTKLQMRRKGISGANSQHKNADTSISPIMDRLSSLIPPPLQKDKVTKSEDEDNDWTE